MSPFQSFLAVIGIVLVIVAAYYTTLFIGKKSMPMYRGQNMKILDRISLSKDKEIFVAEILGCVYIFASSNQAFILLDSLSVEEYAERAAGRGDEEDFRQSGLYGGFLAIKNSGFVSGLSKRRKGGGERADFGIYPDEEEKELPLASEEDDLDIVYRKMQSRKSRMDHGDSQGEGE